MAAQENSLDIGQQQELGKSEFLHPPSLIHFGLSGCNTLINIFSCKSLIELGNNFIDFMIELGFYD